MELKLEDSIEITINNVKLVIKHNDTGYSIDTYKYEGLYDLDEVLIKDEQVSFDDLEECEDYMCYQKTCYGCDEVIQDNEVVCSSRDCWALYRSEHFDDD